MMMLYVVSYDYWAREGMCDSVTAKHLPARELNASVGVAMPTLSVCTDFVRNMRVPVNSTFTSKRWSPIFEVQTPACGRTSDIDESQEGCMAIVWCRINLAVCRCFYCL